MKLESVTQWYFNIILLYDINCFVADINVSLKEY